MRKAGVLLPIASLPSPYGIGDFGQEAYIWVDKLKNMGMKIWQLLPLNPLGYGNSPYQPYSSCAGEWLYISLEKLQEQGLITSTISSFKPNKTKIDYEGVRKHKEKYLKEAFSNFVPDVDYEKFIKEQWVKEYSVFVSLKNLNNQRPWNEWPKEEQDWIHNQEKGLGVPKEEVEYQMFLQYMFYVQWMELKVYANSKGIEVMGDLPIYVGIDSLDVWANQDHFLLDEEGRPTFIAGVPPDYFSEFGQRWGNPIYNWEVVRANGFKFWINRLEANKNLFDIIRIDHFRAFDTYWKIPVSCPTAVEGEWVEAPGYELFDTIFKELPDINIVAEDLGDLRKEVLELRDHYKLKGMYITQFRFDEPENREEEIENMIIYTGTHDNQTIKGWYSSQGFRRKRAIKKYFAKVGYKYRKVAHAFVHYTLMSKAELAILPIQDLINLGDEGRINTPGTVGSPNWEWKLVNFKEVDAVIPIINKMIKNSNR
nr:4-alpha-glucanotransferase [uncultured Niameybacter sp.]